MEVIDVSTIDRTDDHRSWWVAYAVAVAFVATTAVSLVFLPGHAPTSSLAAVSKHYTASDIYGRSELALGMLYVATLAFLWLLAWFWSALRRAGQDRGAAIVLGGGITYVVLSAASLLVATAVAMVTNQNDLYRFEPSTALLLENLSFELDAFAAVAASAVMVAASGAARRGGLVPTALGRAGQVWGVIAGALGILFLGPIPLLIWVLVMAFVVSRAVARTD